jgi:GTP-sensing pleiotropic transcriptional regulator CodY
MMIRLEIVANHSVEENIMEAFKKEGVAKYYTKYPTIYGVGTSGPRMGDAIWPEENFALVIWCEEDEARKILKAVKEVKKIFPQEGIKVFPIKVGGSKSS